MKIFIYLHIGSSEIEWWSYMPSLGSRNEGILALIENCQYFMDHLHAIPSNCLLRTEADASLMQN